MVATIRRAVILDLEAVYQIELECFGKEAFSGSLLEYLLRAPTFVTMIALWNDKPVGFATGSMVHLDDEREGHIYTLDVLGEYRRRGIGFSLLRAIENVFMEEGAKTCSLEARADNANAIGLYLNAGYKPLRTLWNYYGYGIHGIRLEKILGTLRQQNCN